ncbi:MAG: RIP metalloprotease RseP [Deltaproteobacteria bacterium]|jgi:regulator of sigma E protease|nr:RIP metalloprotease RseP [Deltaproteobacteria bacterium]
MLFTLISFIFLLLVLIFVHELGHFLAAKLLGVRVEKFSLGFPPKAWSKKIGETEYQLAWLPLGGFVSLCGETPGSPIAPEDIPHSFSHKPLWVKAIVVAAGPLFNIIFAILALWLVNFSAGAQHLAPFVGTIEENSPAIKAGLQANDQITAINKQPIQYFTEVQDSLDNSQGQSLAFTLIRDGRTLDLTLTPERKEWLNAFGMTASGWSLGFSPRVRPIVGEVIDDKPAAKAGLATGDLILSIDGIKTPDWTDIIKTIRRKHQTEVVDGETIHQKPSPMAVEVLRDGQTLTLTITPVLEPTYEVDGKTAFVPILGFKPKQEFLRESLGVFSSFAVGLNETWQVTKLTVETFVRLFQSKISVKVLGGPIMIAEVAGKKAREGLLDFIWVMALISVNLAIINLVPLPILDGGQLFFFLIEGLRRRPLSVRFREISQWVGATAMVALMVLVFYNDIHRWVTRLSGPAVAQETISDK